MNISAEAQALPFEDAFDKLPYLAMIVSSNGTLVAVNRKARKALELNPDAEQFPALADLLEAPPKDTLMPELRMAASGQGIALKFLQPIPDLPSPLACRVAGIHRRDSGGSVFLVVENPTGSISRVFAELNTRMHASDEEAAKIRRRQMIEGYRRLEKFSYAAAHDLKSPLRSIATLTDFMQEDFGPELPDEATEMLNQIRASAHRLQDLIGDLLEHARSGSVELKTTKIRLSAILQSVQEALAADISEAGAEISIEGPLGEIDGDLVLVRQLFQNLIGNAVKYRAPERTPVIRIHAIQDSDKVHSLTIADNGIGFEPSQSTLLFEPFKRLHSNAKIEGSGVGLATCQTICQRHGWKISGTGYPGQGAEFTIRFG